MFKSVYLVIGASRYSFEQNGDNVKGAKVRYMASEPINDQDNVGYKPIEMNMDYDKFHKFSEGMGFYELTFDMVPGPKGMPKMILLDAQLIHKNDFKDLSDITNS